MNIEGLGDETVELLWQNDMLHDIADIYTLHAERLAALPRLGEKSAANIMRNISSSREVPFARVLFALGIRFVGETTAKYLAAHFRSLDAIMAADRDTLAEADEVGERIAEAIVEYLADTANRDIVERLRRAGLQFESEAAELASDVLAGRSFVISGKFASHSREEMKALVESHGGRNLAAVSANVDYLVAGEKMGPAKLQKAQKSGVAIISEEEFLEMIGGAGCSAPHPSHELVPQQDEAETPQQGTLF